MVSPTRPGSATSTRERRLVDGVAHELEHEPGPEAGEHPESSPLQTGFELGIFALRAVRQILIRFAGRQADRSTPQTADAESDQRCGQAELVPPAAAGRLIVVLVVVAGFHAVARTPLVQVEPLSVLPDRERRFSSRPYDFGQLVPHLVEVGEFRSAGQLVDDRLGALDLRSLGELRARREDVALGDERLELCLRRGDVGLRSRAFDALRQRVDLFAQACDDPGVEIDVSVDVVGARRRGRESEE